MGVAGSSGALVIARKRENRSGVEPGAGKAAFHAMRKMQHRGLRRKWGEGRKEERQRKI